MDSPHIHQYLYSLYRHQLDHHQQHLLIPQDMLYIDYLKHIHSHYIILRNYDEIYIYIAHCNGLLIYFDHINIDHYQHQIHTGEQSVTRH